MLSHRQVFWMDDFCEKGKKHLIDALQQIVEVRPGPFCFLSDIGTVPVLGAGSCKQAQK